MGRYSRMKEVSTTKSKSIDFSDLSLALKAPKPIHDYMPKASDSRINQNKNIPETNTDIHPSIRENETEDTVGEVFGVILSRKCSVSSDSTQNYLMCEKETVSLQAAVKRVLSMKRSSSVSEGYTRIHHQCDDDDDDDGHVTLTTQKTRSIKKRGKIFRACKRIFGF